MSMEYYNNKTSPNIESSLRVPIHGASYLFQ